MGDDDFDMIGDEFVVVNRHGRSADEKLDDSVAHKPDIDVRLEGIDTNTILLTVVPPNGPEDPEARASCDVVLVIDISASMNAPADIPDQAGLEHKERSGLSILDLVKHSCKTILHSLRERDRLAIVTFSLSAEVVQPLTSMTESAKVETITRLDALTPQMATNLWAGLREGLDVFAYSDGIGNCRSLLLLTDGVPNHMCPVQGYVPKLTTVLKKLESKIGSCPVISCFGFGYHIRSGLLRSIAEIGHGKYAFISDAGMIMTVFANAICGLFSTYVTDCTVAMEFPEQIMQVTAPVYLPFDSASPAPNQLLIKFANLQYGHPRHIVLKWNGKEATIKNFGYVKTTISYSPVGQTFHQKTHVVLTMRDSNPTKPSSWAYQVSRHELCEFICMLSKNLKNGEYSPIFGRSPALVREHAEALEKLTIDTRRRQKDMRRISSVEADRINALLDDLVPSSGDAHSGGQVSIALQGVRPTEALVNNANKTPQPRTYRSHADSGSYYEKWGKHYLPSLLHAHMRESCTTFKDSGPMIYGTDSPMFLNLREFLDNAFDQIPPPVPSLTRANSHGGAISMKRYHSVNNPCFLGHCMVRMHDDNFSKVEDLLLGDIVWTPHGYRSILEIVVTNVEVNGGATIIDLLSQSTLELTPWHPVKVDGKWIHPATSSQSANASSVTRFMYTGCVYSLLLDPSSDPEAHAIQVGGFTAVTLGHGMVNPDPIDARAHPFFGDHTLVLANLQRLDQDDRGRRICGGIVKISSMTTDQSVTFKFLNLAERATIYKYGHSGVTTQNLAQHVRRPVTTVNEN